MYNTNIQAFNTMSPEPQTPTSHREFQNKAPSSLDLWRKDIASQWMGGKMSFRLPSGGIWYVSSLEGSSSTMGKIAWYSSLRVKPLFKPLTSFTQAIWFNKRTLWNQTIVWGWSKYIKSLCSTLLQFNSSGLTVSRKWKIWGAHTTPV